MKTDIYKYSFKIIVVIFLSGFIYSSTGLYKMLSPACSVTERSCCCSHNNSMNLKIGKECCCEIKSIPENQSKAVIIISEEPCKNFKTDCLYNSKSPDKSGSRDLKSCQSFNFCIKPADIPVLYSNLRI